jgi:hypothetical protein
MQIRMALTLLALAFLFSNGANAETSLDRSKFHLFNPTPKEAMRGLNTDRPDKTESPYSVDAGHFQIETDLLVLSRDSSGGTTTENLGIMVSNLKLGLTDSIDFQAVVTPYTSVSDGSSKISGFGDTTLRLKVNLFGNNGGDAAFALMPFVVLPTNSGGTGHKFFEGGLIAPLSFSLPGDWDMGTMFQYNRMKNDSNDGFHNEYVTSITFGHDIVGDLAGYVEFWNSFSSETDSKWLATADFGLTYRITPFIQFDAGMNIGVTDSADDLNPFLGFSALY